MWFTHASPRKPRLHTDVSGATVILTVWKRDHLLEQLECLFNQTELPYQIWVYQFGNHIDISKLRKKFPEIEFIHSTVNFKYFGRFSVAYSVESKYIWIMDDDVIPSHNWLAESRKKCERENAIIASAGRIIPEGDYTPERTENVPHFFVGDVVPSPTIPHNFCSQDTRVDFGNNSWFFKTDWIKAFWQIPPFTLSTGEDIHLSASCKVQLNIPTIVPKQIDAQTCGNLKRWYGYDSHASFKKTGFVESRSEIIRHFVEQRGWQPIQWHEQVAIK